MSYLTLLRLPGAARLAFAALVGRIPLGMVPLAYILLLRAVGQSYAVAGSVAAAVAIAGGLAAIPQGRLVDRLGQPRVLVAFAVVNAAAILGLLLAARAGAPPGVLIAIGVLDGLSLPPLSASMRALWPVLTRGDERLEQAFALEAVLTESFFIAGPVIVGLVVLVASPDAAVVTAAVLTLLGTILFATSRVSRGQRGGTSSAGQLGALGAPGLRTLALALLPLGVAFGAIEVAIPAFAEDHGSRTAAGLLLACWGFGSMLGGLWYGTRRWRGAAERRLPVLLAILAVAVAPLALADSIPAMAALLLLAGAPIAPMATTAYLLVDALAPPGTLTEAFTVTTTAGIAGAALGNGAAGALVESAGPSWTLAGATLVALLAPLAVTLRRHTLTPVAAA